MKKFTSPFSKIIVKEQKIKVKKLISGAFISQKVSPTIARLIITVERPRVMIESGRARSLTSGRTKELTSEKTRPAITQEIISVSGLPRMNR